MDNLQLHETIIQLKKLREKHEDQLKIIAFEMCDLPDDLTVELDDCIKLQMDTMVHDFSENYLREFYYNKQKEVIDNRRAIREMRAELRCLKEKIKKELEEYDRLERLTTGVKSGLISEAEMARSKIALENTMQGLENRQKALDIPGDLNIDDLISKVDLLKNITKSKEK